MIVWNHIPVRKYRDRHGVDLRALFQHWEEILREDTRDIRSECTWCGDELVGGRRGRPRQYCTNRCKTACQRDRKANPDAAYKDRSIRDWRVKGHDLDGEPMPDWDRAIVNDLLYVQDDDDNPGVSIVNDNTFRALPRAWPERIEPRDSGGSKKKIIGQWDLTADWLPIRDPDSTRLQAA